MYVGALLACISVQNTYAVSRGQKRATDPLGLELQILMCCHVAVGMEPGSFSLFSSCCASIKGGSCLPLPSGSLATGALVSVSTSRAFPQRYRFCSYTDSSPCLSHIPHTSEQLLVHTQKSFNLINWLYIYFEMVSCWVMHDVLELTL